MTRSFQDQMREDNEQLLESGEHETTVVRYPLGNRNAGIEMQAYVFLDNEQGTNEESGDGAITRDEHGDRERRTALIEIDAAAVTDDRDEWLVEGQVWQYQRHYGRDAALQGIRLSRQEGKFTRLPRTRSMRGGGGSR